DSRAPGGEGSEGAERRSQGAMHVDHIEAALSEDAFQRLAETPPGGESGDAAVRIDEDAPPDAAHGILLSKIVRIPSPHVGAHHGDVVAPTLKLKGQMVYVLRDAAELGGEVLGDYGDVEWMLGDGRSGSMGHGGGGLRTC